MAESDLTRDEILGTNFEYTQAGSLAPEDTVGGPWAGGDEITADKLNQFDKGISDAYVGIIAVADNLSTMSTQVNQIQYVVNSEENNGGLAAQVGRLDSEITLLKDNNTKSGSIAKSIKDAIDPVEARLDAIDGTTPTTLKSRVDDIESKYASKNDLTTQMNTAFNENAFINEIKNAHRTGNELSSPANNYEDSLDSRFDDIEAVLRSKNNNSKGANLNARFIALEAAIETITGSDVDSGSLTALAARIAVLEDALKSALDSDEDNVWDTLEDYLQGLEEDVANLKAEIGQFDNSRIDALETVISHTKDASDETDKGGLTQRIDALEASIGDNEGNSLSGRVAALEGINADNRLNDLEDIATEVAAARGESANLDARLDTLAVAETVNSALETKAAAADLTTLTGRVATLEGKDTVVMTVAAFEALDVASDTVNKNADYIVGPYTEEDNIYKYYRIINNQKKLISGGGGSGTSSAEFYNDITDVVSPKETVDYYIGNSTAGYTHYRRIGETWVTVLPTELINSLGVTATGGLTATNMGDNNNLLSKFVALKTVNVATIYDTDGETPKSYTLTFVDTNGEQYQWDMAAGGGGGSSYSVRLINDSPTTLTIPNSDTIRTVISAHMLIKEGVNEIKNVTATIQLQYKLSTSDIWINGDTYTNLTSSQVLNIDVTRLLAQDATTNIRLIGTVVLEDAPIERPLTFNITKAAISIESVNFNQAAIRTGSAFTFQYKCYGDNLSKIVTFKLDDTVTTQNVGTSHNKLLTQTIDLSKLETRGMHTFQVYFTTNGIQSNVLNYYILYENNAVSLAPMIALAPENVEVTDGDNLVFNYTVNTTGVETTDEIDVEVYTLGTNGEHIIYPQSVSTLTDVTNGVLHPFVITNYPSPTDDNNEETDDGITLYVTMTAKHIIDSETQYTDTKTNSVIINPYVTDYELNYSGNENLLYAYNAYGKSNNDNNRTVYIYPYTDVQNHSTEFIGTFGNFNWSTNGYIDGESILISGGACHKVNVPLFTSTYSEKTLGTNGTITSVPTQNYKIGDSYKIITAGKYAQKECAVGDILIAIADGPQDSNVVIDNDWVKIVTNNTDFNNKTLESDESYNSILTNGRTIEIDYMVSAASDLSATIMDCSDANNTGFKVTPQACYFAKQGQNVIIDQSGLIYDEESIAAAYLTTDKRIHLAFVIEPASNVGVGKDKNEYHQCINIYVNGEFANSCPYDKLNDTLSTTATLTIGSNTCLINLYSIRMYNRGLTHTEILNNYMMEPNTKREQVERFIANDVLDGRGEVSYELAREKYNCLLITGEISPYKKDTKTPCGLTFTKPLDTGGYNVEFNLLDDKGKTYVGDDGETYLTYYSSNNVQGTSSQTYPIHNLKVYLAKEDTETVVNEETGEETTNVVSKKVKYSLKGASGIGESTLCWKADYMSTDHANTYNANLANGLFTQQLPSQIEDSKVQNTVYGVRCLLFNRKDVTSTPVFIADGCLNNDKGNNKTFGLETKGDSGNDTLRQKWEFTNNSEDLCFFKSDKLFAPINDGKGGTTHIWAKDAFESTYPDEGDLEDEELTPNYNHFQILLTWVNQRANYWDASGAVDGHTYTYNGVTYDNEKAYRKAIFKNEFTQHFYLNHVLTYHLFSEFVALCDNRAKNLFMRCDDVRSEVIKHSENDIIFSGNNEPNATHWANLIAADGTVNADYIDWEHSTFAVWAPVLYDLDSCYGVENTGKIFITYDADWNYIYNNKNQFSGVDSRLWLMVEDSFPAELNALASTLYTLNSGLNYNTINTQQIAAMEKSTCPAITNQDMLKKFDAFWANGFIDYSLPDAPHVYRDYKYLQRGSRALQKDAFMRKRANYLSSKYTTNNFMQDQIYFRSSVVLKKEKTIDNGDNTTSTINETGITLTVNQTLYPAITYGDGKTPVRSVDKIAAGGSTTIYATNDIGNTDTIHIGGASALTDIGDISKFEPYNMDVAGGINLKRLVIGTANGTNNSTNKINSLSSCRLLEEINVENCTALQELNLSGNGLIKRVYTYGCNISPVLPNGGVLQVLQLSSAAKTITVLNQSQLTSFSYQDSATNNYENVTRLWVENTPNIPVVDIVNNAISHLDNGLRLVGVNVDLGDNPLFLQNITTEELAKGKYLAADGSFVVGNKNYPYISGTIKISSIRRSLYDKLHTLYPTLIIDVLPQNIITEYAIQYKNYDGTLLYTDYKTATESFIDPVYDTNPITGKAYINIPTKPSDVRYNYRFGLYNTAGYRRFTGWLKPGSSTTTISSTDSITGDTVLTAYYPVESRTLQQYTIKWYEEPGAEPILQATYNYGTPVDVTLPELRNLITRTKIVNGTQYKVFKGWNQPVGRITGNVDVYALWDTSLINNSTTAIDFDNLNAADLYAISRLGEDVKYNLLDETLGNTPIIITMGNDFDFTEGTTMTNLLGNSSKLVFHGDATEARVYDNLHPLEYSFNETLGETEAKDFTFAIDCKFLVDDILASSGLEYVLASCYKQTNNNTINGFKISLVKGRTTAGQNIWQIVVYWGTASVVVDNIIVNYNSQSAYESCLSYRSLIVLEHSKDTPTQLTVHYITPGTTPSDLGMTITSTDLTWANATTSIDTPIILGGNYDYTASTLAIESKATTRQPAKGIIYWCKYWDTDLGATNCHSLAAWPHENVAFYLCGYNNGNVGGVNRNIIRNTNLTLVAAQAIGDRLYNIRTNNINDTNAQAEGYGGWSTYNTTRNFYDTRIYEAFPTSYRSIINKTTITSNSNKPVSTGGFAIFETENYIFTPCTKEVSPVGTLFTDSNSKNSEALSTWSWLITQTATVSNVYGFPSGYTDRLEPKQMTNVNAYRYRFNDYPLLPTARIFSTGNVNPCSRTQWPIDRTTSSLEVQPGDIWDTGSDVYIYVSSADIEEGAYVDLLETDGGWRAAKPWDLRTYTETGVDQTTYYYFEKVDAKGALVDGASLSSNNRPAQVCVVPEFAI